MKKENNQKDLMELDNEFYRKRGKALNIALAVENYLEFFISNYFIRPQNAKTFFFNEVVTQRMSFTGKIRLFENICKREQFNKKEIKKLVKLIEEIRDIRNKIAHWDTFADIQKMEISLMKNAEIISVKNHLKLDDKMIQDFDNKKLKAITGITIFYFKYSTNGTIDEK